MIKIPKEELEKIKQSLQAEINRLNSQNGELKGKLDNTKKETKKLLGEARIEINGLKDKIESLNHETEIERKTHKLETKNLQILIGEGKEELETKKTRIKDLREQLEKSTTNHKELQSNHNSLEEAGQKFLDAYRLKEQELAELAWQIKQERTITYTFYQTQGNKFIKLKAESEEDRANFLANLRSKQGKFANLTQEISDLGDTSDDLLISKNSKITALHDKVQAKEEIITELTTKSNRKQKQIILLDQQLVADQTKIKDLTQLLTQKEKEVEQLTNRLTNTQQKLVRTEQYQQNRIANLINQQTSLTNELTELEEVGKKLLSTYFQKEEELVGKENQISNFMNMTRNFSQKMMEVLNEKLQEIKRWEDYYEQTSNLLTKKNYKISTLINELDTIKNERDTYLTELNQLDQDFREQERLLIHKNTKLSQEITKTNNLESENQTLKGQLTYYFDQDNKLRQTIQDLQNQLNSHTHTHTRTNPYLLPLSFNSFTGTAYLSDGS